MIKSILWLLLFAMASLSCSPEVQETENRQGQQNLLNETLRKPITMPANPDNEYDKAGWMHNQILEAYTYNTPASLAARVMAIESIAQADATFLSLAPGYTSISTAQLNVIVQDNLTQVLSNSSLSAASQNNLNGIIDNIFDLESNASSYEAIYNLIVAYESGIIGNTALPESERKIILTTTSIARYAAFYDRKKGKDKDWRMSRGSLTSAIYGSQEGPGKAIIMSLAGGLYNNGN
ncbi:hypothetical protein HYN59_16090 [Flavobacterium album]|uniref:Uncharacterized protein n=1 Tax=Flavobacterium album TaxID=2175091 RepID=A0A2S1R1W3_9FLAO|nr:hypothetical protein [Flavobacterium album]AWH86531.1 hypothetical protein HYN59_16090 [Flavobacterium album]